MRKTNSRQLCSAAVRCQRYDNSDIYAYIKYICWNLSTSRMMNRIHIKFKFNSPFWHWVCFLVFFAIKLYLISLSVQHTTPLQTHTHTQTHISTSLISLIYWLIYVMIRCKDKKKFPKSEENDISCCVLLLTVPHISTYTD